jgi:hypothetical protein
MADELLTTGDAAQAIGVREWMVSRLYERGFLPEPPRLAGKRVLKRSDLPAIRDAAVRARYMSAPQPA